MIDNEVLRQLTERKSVRAFMDRKIEDEKKDAILRAAFESPTAGNQQMYTIIDITDEDLKEKLSVLCDNQPFIKKAPMVLVFVADALRWTKVYEAADAAYREPEEGDLMLAVADTCIAAQNAVTAAWSLEIGSCYIGDILENCEGVREVLNLPEYVLPAAMIVFGYPTDQQMERRKPARFDKDYIVVDNTYKEFPLEKHKEAVIKRAKRNNKQNFDFDYWTKAFADRKYNSEFSKEMSRSVKEYLKQYNNN